MTVHRTALASAIVAACAVIGNGGTAQAQTVPGAPATPAIPAIPATPLLPAGTASGAAAENLASAPTTYLAPSVAVLATGTSNANFGTGLSPRSDTVLEVVPSLVVVSDHAHWHLRGDFSLDGLYYARGTQTNRVLPIGSLDLRSELVDRLLYLNAGVTSQQNLINPYVGQQTPGTSNQYTSTQYRINPYIDRLINPGLRFIASSDDIWTKINSSPTNAGVFGGRYTVQTVSLDQRPLPWGYTLIARQTDTTYTNLPFASLKDTSFRAIGNDALSDRLTLGLIGGYERVTAFLAEEKKPIYGVRGSWQPNALGNIDATVEHRYFGTGWNIQARGGSPLLRFNMSWTRGPSTYLSALAGGGVPGSNITTLLDGMLLAQYPDPVARAQAVQGLLTNAGLPAGLSTANNFYTSSATLQNALSFTALVLRQRNSYAISLYRTKTQDFFLPGQSLLQFVQTFSSDNTQTGVAFNYGRRLTPLDNLNVTLLRANNSGFGFNAGLSSRQTSLVAQFDHQFSPRTTGLLGVRRQLLRSTLIGSSNESAVFAGVVHRF